jgi:hypothetical protein
VGQCGTSWGIAWPKIGRELERAKTPDIWHRATKFAHPLETWRQCYSRVDETQQKLLVHPIPNPNHMSETPEHSKRKQRNVASGGAARILHLDEPRPQPSTLNLEHVF